MKLNGLDHIGIPTDQMEKSAAFYEELGFTLAGKFDLGGREFRFYQAGSLMLELIPSGETAGKAGAVDHYAIRVDDINEAFEFCKAHGYEMLNDDIVNISSFWANGCKCFNILGPCGEKIEFCELP